MRREISAREGTNITEKGRMIMWGTVMVGNPVNIAHANVETVPKNPDAARVALILEDHANA